MEFHGHAIAFGMEPVNIMASTTAKETADDPDHLT
jgi:hypothetical protein